jgi:acetyl/propionyl-CoA carboxylase alpha subunit
VRTAQGVWVGWPGGARFFGREQNEAPAGEASPADVRAPMTGRVVKVPAGAGRDVQADEVLVVLQAMKMEYRLTAPRAGRVESVRCAEGEMVELGATLVTLAPLPGPPMPGARAVARAPSERARPGRRKRR